MFTIELNLRNPLTGESKRLFYQFDPATMTQTKWNNAYPAVKTEIDALSALAVQNNPPTW
ncbi:MAG: hypothetical protein WEA80_01900 [Gemmatimonadaceae bacterium]